MVYKLHYPKENMYIIHNTDFNENDLFIQEIGHSKTIGGVKKGPWMRDSYIIHYVVKGCGSYNGMQVNNGQGFLICPNQVHDFSSNIENPWEHYWIMFKGVKAKFYLQNMEIPPTNHIFNYDWGDKIIPLLHNIIYQEDPCNLSSLYLLGIFYIILSFHNKKELIDSKEEDIKAKYVQKASSFINTNYQYNIRIKDVAAHVNITSKYLCRIFKEYMGCSPQTYLINTRINHAEELMQYEKLSIREIANSVGYDNPLIFSQIYKKYKHKTPSKFKQIVNKDRS